MSAGFMFPGQGSQEVGMLGAFASEDAVVRTLAQADAALGLPLSRLIAEGPEAELNRTEVTQPALLTASVALWRLWRARGGGDPVAMAGHSLGEYSALVCADALEFEDAVRLVQLRGRLMQRAVPEGQGAMAAILGLDDGDVAACCAAVDGVVSPANFNAPGQIVIAGASAAVDAAIERCKAQGAKRAIRLAVSVPSHCALMKPVAEEFAAAVGAVSLRAPRVPVVQNVDGTVSTSPDEVRARLVRQLSEPVRWTRCIEAMSALGVRTFVECGPGRVLAGLVKRIDRTASTQGLADAASFAQALAGGAT